MKKHPFAALFLALLTVPALAHPGHPSPETTSARPVASVLLPTVTIEAPAPVRHPAGHAGTHHATVRTHH